MVTKKDSKERHTLKLENELSPPLKKIYRTLASLLHSQDKDSLIFRFKLGEYVQQITSDPEKKYGDNAVGKLTAALGISTTEAYTSAIVRAQWTDEDCERFLNTPLPNGRLISYTHLIEISALGNSSVRRKLIDRVYEEGLTTRDLREIVRSMTSRKRKRTVDPKKVLRTLARWIQNMEKLTDEMQVAFEGVPNDQSLVQDKRFFDLVTSVYRSWDVIPKYLEVIYASLSDLYMYLADQYEASQSASVQESEEERSQYTESDALPKKSPAKKKEEEPKDESESVFGKNGEEVEIAPPKVKRFRFRPAAAAASHT